MGPPLTVLFDALHSFNVQLQLLRGSLGVIVLGDGLLGFFKFAQVHV